MRHGVKKAKLQRTASHRDALLANLACSLITHGRITTTLAKAKALRPHVEKLITLGKAGTIHARRLALAALPQPACVRKLFTELAAACKDRTGGYTRIIKLGHRKTDSAPMGLIEIIDLPRKAPASTEQAPSVSVAANSSHLPEETPAGAPAAPSAAAERPPAETPITPAT